MSGAYPAAAPLRILILGGASGIAIATARLYAAEGAALLLVGRHPSRLETVAQDLRVRGARAVVTFPVDLAAEPDPAQRLAEMAAALGGVDHILVAYGVLGDQGEEERDAAAAAQSLAVNFTSAAGWTLAAANLIEAQGRGSLVVLGSVAGDRGRRANYIYGAAKAGIAALVEGVAHRFGRSSAPGGANLRAVIVKVGPTRTPMTSGMRRDGHLWAEPAQVATIVRRAAERGGPVEYAPRWWRWIMLVIRNLPSRIFNKLNV
jgi:decaprenylphospho-beta-D-erythro-pentofuranosid-2-ulose 2-reductase